MDNGQVVGAIKKKQTRCIKLEDVKITYLSLSKLSSMTYKDAYRELFDLIYFGNGYMKYFDALVVEATSARKSLLLVENHVFVVAYRDKELNKLWEETKEAVEKVKSAVSVPCDVTKDPYIRYVIKGD